MRVNAVNPGRTFTERLQEGMQAEARQQGIGMEEALTRQSHPPAGPHCGTQRNRRRGGLPRIKPRELHHGSLGVDGWGSYTDGGVVG